MPTDGCNFRAKSQRAPVVPRGTLRVLRGCSLSLSPFPCGICGLARRLLVPQAPPRAPEIVARFAGFAVWHEACYPCGRPPRPGSRRAIRSPRAEMKPSARFLLLAPRLARGLHGVRPSAAASGTRPKPPRSLPLAGETKRIKPMPFYEVSSVDNSTEIVDKWSVSVENSGKFAAILASPPEVIHRTARLIPKLLTSYPQNTLVIFLDLLP